MIVSEHTVIRTAEPDDAASLLRLYELGTARAALLDPRREPLLPSLDELRETFSAKDTGQAVFYTIEDRTGVIRGFCAVRGLNVEAGFGEVNVLFFEIEDYATPLAGEAALFVRERAFDRFRLRKIICLALDDETAMADFLLRSGFERTGTQREVFYSGGRWHDIDTFSLWAEQTAPEHASAH